VEFSLPSDAQLAGRWSGDSVTLQNKLHGDWLQAELWTSGPRPVLLRSFALHQGQAQGLFHLQHVFVSGDADSPTLSKNGSLLTLQLSPAGSGRATRLSFHRSL